MIEEIRFVTVFDLIPISVVFVILVLIILNLVSKIAEVLDVIFVLQKNGVGHAWEDSLSLAPVNV